MTETGVVQAVAQYAEEILGKDGFRYVSAVVANCKMLALELEATDAGEETEEGKETVNMEALTIAAYLHDISTATQGFHNHQLTSAEMAANYLRTLHVPPEQISKVEQIILTHTATVPVEQRDTIPLEGRILYDADKLGRLSGVAVVTSLIEFGARYPNRAVNGDVLAAILRHIEERFVELYQSLNTAPARALVQEKFGNTLAFLDGVIEHLADATPV